MQQQERLYSVRMILALHVKEEKNMLKSYVAFDLETTGLDPTKNDIIEIGALKVRDGKVEDRFMEFACPKERISPKIEELTGITNDMVANSRCSQEVVKRFLVFCGEDILIGHNVIFDYSFVKMNAVSQGMSFERFGIDTLKIARKMHKDLPSKSLESMCQYYNIENKSAHRAYCDALATAKLYQTLSHYFEEQDPKIFKPQMLMYRPKKILPATHKQIELLTRLSEENQGRMEWDPTTITRNDASRLIDQMLNGKSKN